MKQLLILLIAILLGTAANAQHCSLYKVTYNDSLVATSKTSIIYNKVTFTNPNPKHVRIQYKLEIPKGYKSLAKLDGIDYLDLAPGQTKVFPLNILKLQDASPDWNSIKLKVWEVHVHDTDIHHIYIRTLPDYKFSVRASDDPINLFERPDELFLEANIKNTGNSPEEYTLLFSSEVLGIKEVNKIKLQPRHDTTYSQRVVIKPGYWAKLYKDEISLTVIGMDKSVSHNYPIVKAKSNVKQNKNSYKTIPLVITGGLLSMGDQLTYYGGVSGDLKFGDRHGLSFYYQSKQFGTLYYGYQPNVFGINYHYKNWVLMAGPTTNNTYFASSGLGVSVGYRSEKTEVNLATNIPDPNLPYQNNNYTAFGKYRIKSRNISHTVVYNSDNVSKINSYIVMNTAEVLKRRHLSFNVSAGAGMSEKADTVLGAQHTSGYALGYAGAFESGKWRLTSSIDYRSLGFPGLGDGSRSEMHGLYYGNEKGAVGIIYNAFYIKRNVQRDSFYNSDILNYNSSRFGLDLRKNFRNMAINVSAGLLMNKADNTSTSGAVDHSTFFDFNHSWRSGTYMNSLLNFRSAYYPQVDAVAMTAMLTFNSKYFSINGIYTQIPLFETVEGKPTVGRMEQTINGGPALNFAFFNRRLATSLRYNFAKSVYDNQLRMGAGGSISYAGQQNGVQVSLSGYIPFDMSNSSNMPLSERHSLQLSVVKRLNLAIPGTRQYYNMSLQLFEDLNNNGVKDENERPLRQASVTVNDQPFITNNKGMINYKRIEKRSYEVNLSQARIDSLVPMNNSVQTMHLKKSEKFNVPFRKGRQVKGTVIVESDSFSVAKLTPDLLKITIQDSAGRKYTTITDRDGNFSFYVPAGYYKVSLNEDAFEGSPFRPEQEYYEANMENKEEEYLKIIIKQKKRKVRYLNGSADKQ